MTPACVPYAARTRAGHWSRLSSVTTIAVLWNCAYCANCTLIMTRTSNCGLLLVSFRLWSSVCCCCCNRPVCVLYRRDATRCAVANLPIDYSYVRLQHIAAVNALCHEFFWPGIDRMCDLDPVCSLSRNYIPYLFAAQSSSICFSVFLVSECLQYPDFSCVALYRQVYNISVAKSGFELNSSFLVLVSK